MTDESGVERRGSRTLEEMRKGIYTGTVTIHADAMSLLPKGSDFFRLFAELHRDVERMSALFTEFVREFGNIDGFVDRAHEIESSADKTAHRIVEELNRSFITPFDREDIHRLAYEMDEIVDLIEDIVRNVHLYHFSGKVEHMDEFAACISQATVHLGKMVVHLKDMKHTPAFLREKIAIHEIEDKADLLFESAIDRLFRESTDPILVIKTKDILEEMETVVDKYQHVGNMIESIVIKMS